MLEELGEPFTLEVLSLKAGDERKPAYLAINPMGKVPALKDGDVIVTEVAAICCYLADTYPKAKLAPPESVTSAAATTSNGYSTALAASSPR